MLEEVVEADHILASFEDDRLDFTEVMSARREQSEDHARQIRRTACSFANTDGGWIVFGVKDGKKEPDPAQRIVGIPLNGELRKELGDKLAAIEPALWFETLPRAIPLPTNSSYGIFVVYIPRSLRSPHMVEQGGGFFMRGAGGQAVPMRWQEVRDQMVFADERLRRANLGRLQLRLLVRLAKELRDYGQLVYRVPDRFDAAGLSALLSDICVFLPPDDPLIERLLSVVAMDSRANVMLDRFMRESGDRGWTDLDLRGVIFELHRVSEECDGRLQNTLGPIGLRESRN